MLTVQTGEHRVGSLNVRIPVPFLEIRQAQTQEEIRRHKSQRSKETYPQISAQVRRRRNGGQHASEDHEEREEIDARAIFRQRQAEKAKRGPMHGQGESEDRRGRPSQGPDSGRRVDQPHEARDTQQWKHERRQNVPARLKQRGIDDGPKSFAQASGAVDQLAGMCMQQGKAANDSHDHRPGQRASGQLADPVFRAPIAGADKNRRHRRQVHKGEREVRANRHTGANGRHRASRDGEAFFR